MFKRLHLGRARPRGGRDSRPARCARLHRPDTRARGPFGSSPARVRPETDRDPADRRSRRDLGDHALCLKRYACHITAHTPVTAVMALREAHGFAAPRALRAVVVRAARAWPRCTRSRNPRTLSWLNTHPVLVATRAGRRPSLSLAFRLPASRDPVVARWPARSSCERPAVAAAGRPRRSSSWPTGRRLDSHVRFPGTPAMA